MQNSQWPRWRMGSAGLGWVNYPWEVRRLCIVVSRDWENDCGPGRFPREISCVRVCAFACTFLFLHSESLSQVTGPSQSHFCALMERLSYLHLSVFCSSICVVVFCMHVSPPPTKWWVPVKQSMLLLIFLSCILFTVFLVWEKSHNTEHTILTIFNCTVQWC